MYKISEQQVNPKVLSVAKSCHYNENFKKWQKILYRQMPAPRRAAQQILAPLQQLGCNSPRVGTSFWCKFPGVRGGGWLWMKLIPALRSHEQSAYIELNTVWKSLDEYKVHRFSLGGFYRRYTHCCVYK